MDIFILNRQGGYYFDRRIPETQYVGFGNMDGPRKLRGIYQKAGPVGEAELEHGLDLIVG